MEVGAVASLHTRHAGHHGYLACRITRPLPTFCQLSANITVGTICDPGQGKYLAHAASNLVLVGNINSKINARGIAWTEAVLEAA